MFKENVPRCFHLWNKILSTLKSESCAVLLLYRFQKSCCYWGVICAKPSPANTAGWFQTGTRSSQTEIFQQFWGSESSQRAECSENPSSGRAAVLITQTNYIFMSHPQLSCICNNLFYIVTPLSRALGWFFRLGLSFGVAVPQALLFSQHNIIICSSCFAIL